MTSPLAKNLLTPVQIGRLTLSHRIVMPALSRLRWVQSEGGSIGEVRPGDVVWFPPGERHWHGATPTTAMTHIAVQESLNGKNVDWAEKVSEAQYRR